MSATNPFNPGDLVQLKSGGPHMTVSSFHNSADAIYCLWFDPNSILHEGHFNPLALDPIPPTSKPETLTKETTHFITESLSSHAACGLLIKHNGAIIRTYSSVKSLVTCESCLRRLNQSKA